MNAKRIIGIILAVLGAIAFLGSLLGNFSIWGDPGFGYKQIVGTVVGAIVAVIGIILLLQKKI